eukprot:UN1979
MTQAARIRLKPRRGARRHGNQRQHEGNKLVQTGRTQPHPSPWQQRPASSSSSASRSLAAHHSLKQRPPPKAVHAACAKNVQQQSRLNFIELQLLIAIGHCHGINGSTMVGSSVLLTSS